MGKVFVTGGSGFVGRTLIGRLRRRGDQVLALARSTTSAAAVQRAGAAPVMGDLDDRAMMVRAMAGCELVVHAAAAVEKWGPAKFFHQVNVVGTENVLAASKEAGVPRLVHVSTEAVLFDGKALVDVDETYPYPARPLRLYPKTKMLAEKLVLAANSPELTTVAVRPRLVWGKGDSSLLPIMIAAVQRGRFMWIDGSRQLISTCHVENACEGILAAADKGQGGEAYFLTDGEPVIMHQFVTDLLATRGIEAGDRSIPRALAAGLTVVGELAWRLLPLKGDPPMTGTDLMFMSRQVTVDDSKARRELGYAGATTIAAGLEEMRQGG